ncbi:MAG: histidine--tRNA ligase [Anaerolineae bacterium]
MYRAPKGTQDILPAQQPYWEFIRNTATAVCRRYGFEAIDVPIFEETRLFVRGVGEATDIVEKEMYSFRDKGDTEITLRPEFTAGVVRAYIEHGMHTLPQPVKLFSIGPAFRYERPQAGRFRQYHQLNIEAIGEQDPLVDAEVMSVVWEFFQGLGFRKLQYQLNNIGCPHCRPAHIAALTDYYRGHVDRLCPDCLRRLERNPLRLLDCKVESCAPLSVDAPRSIDYLCQECAVHFAKLRSYLEALERPYVINHRLVRGLDYYTKTVFEVWAEGIGAQNAICGGGRYDGLVEQLGGRPTPGLGVASGLERVVLSMQQQGIEPPQPQPLAAYFVYLGDAAKMETLRLLERSRTTGLTVECAFGDRSAKAQLKAADRAGARYAVIIGEDELMKGVATVRSLFGAGQDAVPLTDLVGWLQARPH